jgi:Mn-dependent DtxR family transcriptional regulator
LNDEVLGLLSNLGAISEEKAVNKEIVAATLNVKLQSFQEDISRLVHAGYLKQNGDMIYLTEVGLIRALSRFS